MKEEDLLNSKHNIILLPNKLITRESKLFLYRRVKTSKVSKK